MRYIIDKHDRYVVVEPLVSFLDTDAVAKLKGEFLLRNTIGQRNIVLDLSNVDGTTYDGMRMGLLAHRLCQTAKGLFIIIGINADIMNMIRIATLDRFFVIVETLEEAEDLIFANEIHRDLIGE